MALKDIAKLIREANQEKTPAQEFARMYAEAVVRLDKPYTPSKTFKPSSLGGCLRNCFFQLIGAQLDRNNKKDPQLCEMGDSGTDRHERIQSVVSQMQSMGYPIEWLDVAEYLKMWPQPGTKVVKQSGFETKIFNEILNLSFMCDGLIRFLGQLYVLEIKTEISFKFLGRSGPADDHKTQATCYGACLGIPRALFFYENRDNCSKKAYVVDVTKEEIDERVISRIELVNQCVESGKEAPPKTEIKKQCNYCSYKEECQKW